jgi:hypothetical protein
MAMPELSWERLPNGALLASGDDWAYLIAQNAHRVTLTRWVPRTGETGSEVAAQAALYAIHIGGAYGTVPEAADVTVLHLKRIAQVFESGGGAAGQPSWQHDREAKPCTA